MAGRRVALAVVVATSTIFSACSKCEKPSDNLSDLVGTWRSERNHDVTLTISRNGNEFLAKDVDNSPFKCNPFATPPKMCPNHKEETMVLVPHGEPLEAPNSTAATLMGGISMVALDHATGELVVDGGRYKPANQ